MKDNVSIIDIVELEFGVYKTPPSTKTFIMPDGMFLNLDRVKHHSDVEKFLIEKGLAESEFAIIGGGSPTLSHLGCIRLDPKKQTCILPACEYPSEEALNSLLLWLDMMSSSYKYVTVVGHDGQSVDYHFSEYITDDIISRVRRYYISNVLYEHQVRIVRASGATYKRQPVGYPLELEIKDKSLRESNEIKFISDHNKEEN